MTAVADASLSPVAITSSRLPPLMIDDALPAALDDEDDDDDDR